MDISIFNISKRRGFSLIELLVVLVILGLIAGVVGPKVIKHLGKAKGDTAELQLEKLSAALDVFYLENGRYPSASEGLKSLVEAPPDMPTWNGPYLKKRTLPVDPWGRPYIYRFPGEYGDYDLYSLGADGKEGGEKDNKDHVSWE